jgi:D-amino-acid dehydrogenase
MKVFILGGGIVGVSTAYFLNKYGYDVTIIDRQSEVARECSYANGAQLSYTNAEPWATPDNFKKAFKWLIQKNAPLKINFLRFDPALYKWLFHFALQCRELKTYKNTLNILNLNLYNKALLEGLDSDFNFDFSFQKNCGILHVFHSKEELEQAKEISIFQAENGGDFKLLTKEQCFLREPSLKQSKVEIVGGIVYDKDEVGDMFSFTQNLAKKIKKSGVKFVFGQEVESIHKFGGKIISIKTNKQTFSPDALVIATGATSPLIAKKVGVKVPVYPMKGYSITYKVAGEDLSPQYSIMDQKEKVVFTRLDNRIRVAGTAELNGYNYKITKSRIDYLKELSKKYFGQNALQAGEIEKADAWACLRPSTVDGLPIIGKTKIRNLYLATGNGTLGWTQGLATARLTADIISGKTPEIDTKPMLLSRF